MDHRRGRGITTLGSLLALAGVVAFLNVMPASGEVVPPAARDVEQRAPGRRTSRAAPRA